MRRSFGSIANRLRKLVKGSTKKETVMQDHYDSEDEYYEDLFVNNPSWNKKGPNSDESLRWEIIENFIKTLEKDHFSGSKSDVQILDLGCGRGWLTNLLSKHGTVLGIEPVEKVIEYAKKMFPKLKFIAGESSYLIEHNYSNQFDLVVSSEVIEHIVDDKKNEFVNNIHQLLKEQGYVIITTPRQEAQEEWNRSVNTDQPIEEWISEKEMEALFKSEGFEAMDVQRIALSPNASDYKIDIYQLWLFKKVS